jgi:hypothetical protein
MDAQGSSAAVTPTVADAKAREGDEAELTVTLPGPIDPDTGLSDADLESLSGGNGPAAPPRGRHMTSCDIFGNSP